MSKFGAIDGVIVKSLTVHKDIPDLPAKAGTKIGDRGFLMEIVRRDDGMLKQFAQSTMTVAHKDSIKAFHWHKNQDDLWFVATGQAQIVLYDRRAKSTTYGLTQKIMAGAKDYKVILIPAGVAHGYKVLSKEPVILFYHTTATYNANDPDEQRIAWNDPEIGYKWD